MEALDCIEYRGYRIEVVADEDARNPLTEFDVDVTLALHSRAEHRFGWTTNMEWAMRLDVALAEIAERGVTRNLYGPSGALAIVNRWLKVAHGIPVVLHVSALDHSGVMVYLGAGDHPHDPGGWDSGWIGWLFVTPEQAANMGSPADLISIEHGLRAWFDEFAAWVAGEVLGYRIVDPDGIDVDECYGIYDRNAFNQPDGWALLQCHGIVDADITSRVTPLPLKGY